MREFRPLSPLVRALLLFLAAGVLSAQPIILTLSTSANSLQGGQTATITALLTGDPNAAVTWSFTPNVGSTGAPAGPSPGGISTIVYHAPALVANAQTVTVTATSVADPAQAASVFIQLTPVPVTVRVSPATVTLTAGQTQQFSATVSGVNVTGVTWSLGTQAGSIDPATGIYTAPATIAANQNVSVIATSVFNGTSTGTATVTLQAPPTVTVSVAPTAVTLAASQTQQFAATVQNTANTAVTWTISPQTGTIDQTGLYTAPQTISGTSHVTVTATSVADPSKAGTATVTLQAPPVVSVAVSPATVALVNSGTQQFTATVTNATNTGVTWSINPLTGAIDQTGLYTAPVTIVGTPKITVTATSVADPTKSGTATINLSTVIDVGTGAPTPSLLGQFISAYNRNGFASLVSLPPLGQVKALGTTGFVQEFADAAKDSGVKLALATASPTAVTLQPDGSVVTVFQILADEYAYYGTVGATTAGLPLEDTMACPFFDAANSCTYQFFDKGYALFAYAVPLLGGQSFTIRLAFYTEWTKLGGINGPGRPIGVETPITASTSTTATVQSYVSGAIYTITSGTNKNLVFGVTEPIYDLYVSGGGPGGSLGLPVGELTLVSPAGGGVYRQLFEHGALQYTANGPPVQELPVTAVVVTGAPTGNTSTTTLNVGQTLTLTASPMDTNGDALTDRPVSWSTTNGKAVSIQPSGLTAVVTAIGGGSASVTASSSGVTSAAVKLLVIAPCCQVGDGAPQSVQQAFQNALTRNGIAVQLPVAAPAGRIGNGYVQTVQSTTPGGAATYLVASADQASAAFVVSGATLAQYQSLGGPAGALGYPVSDQSAGGTQRFANGAALAGNPVHLVTGPVLAKWALLGYETGAAGAPVAEAAAFSTFGANSGVSQAFSGGAIYAATAGPLSGRAYFVSGLILAAYNAGGAAGGAFGMAMSDEFVTGGVHQQNFEGGNITYAVGDAAAQTHAAPKTPAVIVAPSSITAGGSVQLAVSGFANNSTIRVSVSGEPDFVVTTASGAYSWSMFIPLGAASATVAIHAADTGSTAAADGVLTVKGLAASRIQLVKVQGDNQSGAPGALLPLPLQVKLADASGTPVVGATVVFQASPGAQLSAASALTDSAGSAQTFVRLPPAAGTAIVTASSPSAALAPVDFYALAAATSLSGFPNLRQTGKGALVTAVASILQYRQNRGELASPNGTATQAALTQFLSALCSTDVNGKPLCDGFISNANSGEQIVNLWRAVNFTGGADVSVENATPATVADFVAQGEPVLLSLGLSLNGAVAGGHYVVATGIGADGSIAIQDPNPLFARTNLNDYLNGFAAGGGTWTATLLGVVRFPLRGPSPSGFLVAALSQSAGLMANLALDVSSAAGACGTPLQLLDSVDASGNPPAAGPLVSRIRACDGLQPLYQIGIGAAQSYQAFVTDLAQGGPSVDVSGTAPAAYQATRPLLNLALAPLAASFAANAVVNAASFTSGIAPGGLVAIFGSGLFGPAAPTTVSLDGAAATVIAATPFQVNAVIPPATAPGAHTLRVTSAYGSAQQPVNVAAAAPAIFLLGGGKSGGNQGSGAVVNPDFSVNGPANPVPRGQYLTIYATGLGAVVRQGPYSVTSQTVTVLLNGVELPALFSGLTPGYSGLYQVNVVVPAAAPGLSLSLSLKEGGQLSNVVFVAIQ